MKRFILKAFISFFIVLQSLGLASQSFDKHKITDTYTGICSVYATDLNGDGHTDILAASDENNDNGFVSWWRNNGNQEFTRYDIDTTSGGPHSVFAIDIDGDGNMDVLCATGLDSTIAWYRNDGNTGFPSFTKHYITDNCAGAYFVHATDVDGDQHTDVVGGSYFNNTIDWWKNDGGAIPSFSKHTIDNSFGGPWSVFATDLNGDGHTDVVGSGAFGTNETSWWINNDGNENFFKIVIDDSFFCRSVFAIDIDGDGDTDILGADPGDGWSGSVKWWENNGASIPNFIGHLITSDLGGACSALATDIDGDGDMDIVVAAGNDDNSISWWKNNGSESFTRHTIDNNYNDASSVYATDIDGDGNLDIVGSASGDNELAWWKQDPGIGSVEDFQNGEIAIEMYSSDQTLYIQNPENQKGNVSIHDMTGRSVSTHSLNRNENQSISLNLETGIYIVVVQTEKGSVSKKIIIE